ncbi:hypothetical protein PENANT_c020G01426 [Penicillium antarcticum]|uniref:Myb-like DNA-binding domain-containing protein n=1 Tax=Penicillium antarcticum TaxID=416450 RepID=A0A1V6Q090_9EURO|nr:uncharacterized protein N7508_004316 [Penicillium antarcticum]KAJ5308937.1 hypothetical protein N7508_004316 [Penicillium antarcticum]OQD82651.1 hypothetical protein PENANT_c020G01426 [Penicillium antarcticum]
MPPKAASIPQGTPSKVKRTAVDKAKPIKAAKDATMADKEVVFLLNLIKFQGEIDYQAAADGLGMNAPAVRMRYTRIRNKMEGKDDSAKADNTKTTEAGN